MKCTCGHEFEPEIEYRHRLICGDATDPDVVARVLQGEQPEQMVTDPPYGVEYDPTWRAEAGVNKNPHKMGRVRHDDRADWREAWELFPGSVAYVWHAALYQTVVQESLEACGFEIVSQIVWAKDRFALSRGDYHWKHELCWYMVRTGAKHLWGGARDQHTVWEIARADDKGHGLGTQKPVECMERPIRNHTAQIIYDPFVGTGSTILGAERQRRRCMAVDIEPRHCAIVLDRWMEMTEQEPVLLSDH